MNQFAALPGGLIALGMLIGLASAAPVGPVNLIVIQCALRDGTRPALLLGLGSAAGEALFATVAAFGVGALARQIGDHGEALRLIGGAVMLAFAVAIWRSAPHLDGRQPAQPAGRMAAATFVMTVTNPATLMFYAASFGAIGFAAIGHDTPLHRRNAAFLVAGVVAGAMLWWLAVTGIARYLKGRVGDHHLTRINHITAAALAIFGAAAFATGLLLR